MRLPSRDQAGPQRVEGNTALARQVRRVTGAAEPLPEVPTVAESGCKDYSWTTG
jgi:hypothetical protein